MKRQLLLVVRSFLLMVAKASASTPSQMTVFQPEVPKQLKSTK